MIKKVMCCCGGGMGSSLLVKINVQKVLERNGFGTIEVEHASISDANPMNADLFIVGSDLAPFMKDLPLVITVNNIFDMNEVEEKLIPVLKKENEK